MSIRVLKIQQAPAKPSLQSAPWMAAALAGVFVVGVASVLFSGDDEAAKAGAKGTVAVTQAPPAIRPATPQAKPMLAPAPVVATEQVTEKSTVHAIASAPPTAASAPVASAPPTAASAAAPVAEKVTAEVAPSPRPASRAAATSARVAKPVPPRAISVPTRVAVPVPPAGVAALRLPPSVADVGMPPIPDKQAAAPLESRYVPMVREAAVEKPAPDKPAVPPSIQVQDPKVLTVSGDQVYVRVNPRQTLVVSVGGSIPGLGTLKRIDKQGAQFDTRFVPHQ